MGPSCRGPIHVWLAVMAAGITLVFAGSAARAQSGQPGAKGERLVIFPMEDAGLPESQSRLPNKLTRSLARATKERGMKVTVLQASLEDTALMAGCMDTEDVQCHALVLGQLDADSGMTSRVEPAGEGRVKVTVSYIDGENQPRERVFELSDEKAEKDLEGATPALFGDPVDPQVSDDVEVGSGGSAFDFGRVERTSWMITGGGAALMGVGTIFWLSAASQQSKIDDAPIATAEDLDQLASLESGAKTRATIGNIAFFSGMAVAAVGAFFVVRQGLSSGPSSETGETEPAPEPGISWAPVPMPGGVGVTMTMEWR